jgi:hypothetical protein
MRWAPAMTIAVGGVLCALGVAIAAGRAVRLLLPHPGVDTDGPAAAFVYGLSYAITSLGCSIGPFLVVVGATLRHGDMIDGVASYLAYAAGMGLVVWLAGSIAALAGVPGARHLGRLGRVAPLLGGCLLALVGVYLGWYGVDEVRLRSGQDVRDPFVAAAAAIQIRLAAWVDRAGPRGLAGLMIAVLLIAALIGRRRRSATADMAAPASRSRFHLILRKLLR